MTDDLLAPAGGTLEEECVRLGTMLHLDEPVSPDVYVSALKDPAYARNLMLCRETPAFRGFLLDNPPHQAEASPVELSTRHLISNASKSFWEWTRGGFAIVDDEVYERRFSTCQACPHLVDPPDRKIYKVVELVGGARDDAVTKKVCDLCGCVAAKKAKLPHEACPAPHAELAGMNKWGEPMRAAPAPASADG